ncbi:hypothetical protein V2A60_001486 [Cordyceps javanica]|uniref:Ankyrin repeat protein n=1 Tax=Cordyceps javanica TaxID=43265 RepID=A0A545VF95_9HYPO|nr:ankyrin repeat protein [Cordyceps javanica]TQW11587.1 ankyrin repeat protein [Cordyceps javanica]
MPLLWRNRARDSAPPTDLRQIAAAENHECYLSETETLGKTDKHGRTILHWATILGKHEFVKSLLGNQDVEITATDWLGKPAIYYAVLRGDQDMVQVFLNRHKQLHDITGRTALHDAVDTGNTSMVALCSTPELISLPDYNGRTPLHYAARSGNHIIAEYILRKGADAKYRDGKGWTPLHWAARRGCVETLKVIIRWADAAAIDYDDHTALHVAAANGYRAAAVFLLDREELKRERTAQTEILAQTIPDIDEVDDKGHTILHWAVYKKDAALVDAVLKRIREKGGASITLQDKNGHTPLQTALLLTQSRWEVDHHLGRSKGPKGTPALNAMLQCVIEQEEPATTMMDRYKETPLSYAASYGDETTKRLLQEYLKETGLSI